MLAAASSETNQIETSRPRVVLFILNRNDLDEIQIQRALTLVLDTQFGVEEIDFLWLSIFGKLPERPHVLLILSDDGVANELIGNLNFKFGERQICFEISKATGVDVPEECDPTMVFVKGVPVDGNEDDLGPRLQEFFSRIAPVERIIFPPNWQQKSAVVLVFKNNDCAGMVVRVASFCNFEGYVLRCSYFRALHEHSVRKTPPKTPPKTKKPSKGKPKRDYFIEQQRK